jgi:peptidyl-prolyl cis-trans isomerase D
MFAGFSSGVSLEMIRFLQTPGRGKKIALGAILLFICFALVISLGVGGMAPDRISQRGVVAEVGDEAITTQEVSRTAEQMAQQRGYPKRFAGLLAQPALDTAIAQKALALEARRLGLRVSDAELRDELRNGFLRQVLFPNGNFIGQDSYEQYISSNFQLSTAQFESLLKQELLGGKLRALIQDSVAITPADVQREAQRQGTKVKFEYALLTTDDLLKTINPTEKELKEYYESHKASYNDSIPEKRRIKYTVADLNKIQADIKVFPEEINRYYSQHQEEYRRPEQVKASHILVKAPQPGPDGKVDEKAEAAARHKAESLLKQLKAGAKLEELAKKNSDDKVSAAQNGSLGWFQRGAMVPEFEKVAFSLPKGQISDLVKTPFGFHIIRVEDKRAAGVAPVTEVKDSIEQVLRQEKAQNATDSLERALEAEARTKGLEAAAQKHGLQVLTSDLVTRTDSLPGLGAAPEFMEAAFSANEKAPPMVTRTPQAIVVSQVIEVKPPQTPTFEQIKQQVAQQLRQERSRTLLIARTQELSDRARAEHNLKRAAKQLGATLKTSELVGPDSQVPDLGNMSGPAKEAFTLKVGEISAPIFTGRDGAVLALVERKEPSSAELQKSEERVREGLLQRKRAETLNIYFSSLKQQLQRDGKIKINEDELKTLTRNVFPGT